MKEQDKTPEKQLNEVETGNFPEKELRIMIVKMIQDFGKRMQAQIEKTQEMFNKHLEELKKKHLEELKNKQTEMNNTIIEMKNTLEANIGKTLTDTGLGHDFWTWNQKQKQKTQKSTNGTTSNSKASYTAKETINKIKQQPIGWKKIFANHILDKGLISKKL